MARVDSTWQGWRCQSMALLLRNIGYVSKRTETDREAPQTAEVSERSPISSAASLKSCHRLHTMSCLPFKAVDPEQTSRAVPYHLSGRATAQLPKLRWDSSPRHSRCCPSGSARGLRPKLKTYLVTLSFLDTWAWPLALQAKALLHSEFPWPAAKALAQRPATSKQDDVGLRSETKTSQPPAGPQLRCSRHRRCMYCLMKGSNRSWHRRVSQITISFRMLLLHGSHPHPTVRIETY